MRFLTAALFALLTPSLSYAQSACTPGFDSPPLVASGKLTMSINPVLPPMQYVSETGELKGLNVELGNAIAEKLCLTPEYVKIDFQAMVPGLQAGRWDVINTGIFWTEERSKIMYLVNYGSQAVSVIAPAGNPLKIEKPEDLAGKSVAVEAGTYAERRIQTYSDEFVAKGLKPVTIRAFNTGAEAYQALAAGQVEASMSIDTTAAEIVKRGDFAWPLKGIGGAPIAFATANRELAEGIAKALQDLKVSGDYSRMFAAVGFAELDAATFEINGSGPK